MATKTSGRQHEHGMTGSVLKCVHCGNKQLKLQNIKTHDALVVFWAFQSSTGALQSLIEKRRSGTAQQQSFMPTFLLYLRSELENISKIEVPEGGRFCIDVSNNSNRNRNSSSC